MKKLLFFFLLLWIEVNLFPQKSKVWDYPIGPGSTEWTESNTVTQRLSFYNIPEDLLRVMNTGDLVRTCLNYPEWRMIFTRNSLAQGYDFIRNQFNGFRELALRKDASLFLLEHYSKINHDDVKNIPDPVNQGVFMESILQVEILLSQEQIIRNMSEAEQNTLKGLALRSIENEMRLEKYFGTFPREIPSLILARLLQIKSETNQDLKSLLDEKMLIFIKRSAMMDSSVWFRIYELSKNSQ